MDKLKDKPIQIVEDIPENMKQMLINNCQFKDIALSDKERFGKSRMSEKSLYPNRLEQHLLKKILPFMRFGHCPRGPFLQASPFFTNIFGSTPCHYSCAELFAQALLSLCPILRKLKISYVCIDNKTLNFRHFSFLNFVFKIQEKIHKPYLMNFLLTNLA